MSGEEDGEFAALLRFLQEQRGFDFTGYKRPSLMRRVMRRMQTLQIESFAAYGEYLELHADEFGALFNTILINVTSFFRDEAAWAYVRSAVLPALIGAKDGHDLVRVWSAGCASGQEAYSLAIALAEALGADAYRERVKVYATDVDEEALAYARLATYTAREMETLHVELRDKYFEEQHGRFVFRHDLRRAVIFGRHDLVQDAPISRLDLLVCRNTLMYFNAETQQRILNRFHFALNGDGRGTGYLFLGRAEMLMAQSTLFSPLELKCRVFAKLPSAGQRLRAAVNLNGTRDEDAMTLDNRLRDLALDESPLARIVVDHQGVLVLASHKARALFGIGAKDIGRPLQDVEISFRPIELRALIEQAYAERRPVTRGRVERHPAAGQAQYFDVVVAPLLGPDGSVHGAAVTYLDVTSYARLQDDLQHSREEINTTNEELQSSNEELETTNEELQSSNEELETTNEELQSTNEELETMNEELQSTNEELQTVNDELRQRTEDMNKLNAFLQSVLGSLRSAAVVVNQNLDVLMWNHQAFELWGLRGDEVQGRGLLNLDIGLPVSELRGIIRPILSGESEHREIALDAVNRRGKKIRCHVTCTPLISPSKKREGAIILMEETQ